MLFTFMVFSPNYGSASIGYRDGPLRSRTQLLIQRFSTLVDAKMPLELLSIGWPKRATRDCVTAPPMQLGRARGQNTPSELKARKCSFNFATATTQGRNRRPASALAARCSR
jgi:hypothetical protein